MAVSEARYYQVSRLVCCHIDENMGIPLFFHGRVNHGFIYSALSEKSTSNALNALVL